MFYKKQAKVSNLSETKIIHLVKIHIVQLRCVLKGEPVLSFVQMDPNFIGVIGLISGQK